MPKKISHGKKQEKRYEDVSFPVFVAIWNDENSLETPALHYEIMGFLENDKSWYNNTGVLQVWRGAGKSTLVDLFVAWKLLQDPSLRFIILSCDDNTAKKATQDIRSIILRHPLTTHLFTKDCEWQRHTFSVVGAADARNPSVRGVGINSNITGARADYFIYDDVEVGKSSDTADKREQMRRSIRESYNVLVPGGKKLFIGTPWHKETIYNEVIKGGSVSSLTLPLLKNPVGEYPNIKGESRWPEVFTDDVVAEKQIALPKNEFLSQYMLRPVTFVDSYLDPTAVKIYSEDVNFTLSNRQLRANIAGIQLSGATSFWDPALAGRLSRGDDSVLAIVFMSPDGHYWIHDLIALQGDDPDRQCEQVKEAVIKYKISVVNIETNGIGKFLPQVLMRHIRGLGVGVNGLHTTEKKEKRIIENIETPLYAGALHLHEQCLSSPFLSELEEFNPRGGNRDDYIDAVAGAIAAGPIRLGRGGTMNEPMPRWGAGSQTSKIQVNEKIF